MTAAFVFFRLWRRMPQRPAAGGDAQFCFFFTHFFFAHFFSLIFSALFFATVGEPRAVTLTELLAAHEHVDYLDFDIQVTRVGYRGLRV